MDAPEGFDPFLPHTPRPFTSTPPGRLQVALFTDAHVIRGWVETRFRRLTDVLNEAEDDFVVLGDATMEEFGATGLPDRAEFAQVNLSALLFAVTDSTVEPTPELRLVKSAERALVVAPPFKIVGRIHVLPDRDLREALANLTGRFIPVTEGVYWSDTLREPKTPAPFIAFNRARAHVLASHRERDLWQGLNGQP